MQQPSHDIDALLRESQDLDTRAFIAWALTKFKAISFASSLGAEDQALHWLLQQAQSPVAVFSLDTGRLPEETYALLKKNREFFSLPITIYYPEATAVEALVAEGGPNLFYDSLAKRQACCAVRKVAPLRRALAGRDAWFTGMRRGQSSTRSGLQRVEWDAANGLIKLNPLADWSHQDVWDLIERHKLPYNALHDKGYPSLGCAPCTRAVKPGEDERSGRWWWENPEHKECGLHVHEGAGGDRPRKAIGGIGKLEAT